MSNSTSDHQTSGPRLVVQSLVKSYRVAKEKTLAAVQGVDFSIAAGECFGLLGPNGAGKSTTINCITGMYPASHGRILINNIDVHLFPKKARQGLGVCSQEESLDTDFTVIDQLVRHATFFGFKKRPAKERALQLLQRFGLEDKKNRLIEELSGGMRRRLQVIRALVSEPTVLVLDEPTTGLDPDARRNLWEILISCREEGMAILLCTHYMDEAERLCDRIAIMSQGKILDVESPQLLIEKHMGREEVVDEIKPGFPWRRPPNLEDVYLKLTGSRLGARTGVKDA